jgi:hyperosmotically inducible protein
MKTLLLSALITVSGLYAIQASAADSSVDTKESTAGNYVKDSVITTKVKSKLAEKHLSTLTKIKVDTDDQGVVWLSGTAPTQDASDLAALVAKDTDGVTDVHNHIVVMQ